MSKSSSSVSFASKLQELEAIVEWFEKSDIDLDEALVKYERGAALITELKEQLGSAANTIKKVQAKLDGQS